MVAALAAAGRREEALALARRHNARAEAWAGPGAIGVQRHAAALAQGGPEGLALAQEAVERLAATELRLQHLAARASLGRLLRLERRAKASRVVLREVIDEAEAAGALRLARRARDELAATGARRLHMQLAGVGALTPAERRVADLAAAGRTNKEIAAELFLSVKTVETHLRSTFRKLDVARREQLAGALAP